MTEPLPLSWSMESALLHYAGVSVPLWAVHHWTVATIRALTRRGLMHQGVITPKGRRRARLIEKRRSGSSQW